MLFVYIIFVARTCMIGGKWEQNASLFLCIPMKDMKTKIKKICFAPCFFLSLALIFHHNYFKKVNYTYICVCACISGERGRGGR